MIQLNFSMQRPANFLLPMEGAHREGVVRSMGTELAQAVREHFSARPGRRYWAEAADATLSNPAVAGEVEVRQRGVALHLFGGTVLPGKGKSYSSGKPTRLLAIPADGSARGRTPSYYGPGGLVFVPVKKGYPHLRGVLVEANSQKGKGRQAGRTVLFRLVDSVTIPANRAVLPPDREIAAAMARGFDAYLYFLTNQQH